MNFQTVPRVPKLLIATTGWGAHYETGVLLEFMGLWTRILSPWAVQTNASYLNPNYGPSNLEFDVNIYVERRGGEQEEKFWWNKSNLTFVIAVVSVLVERILLTMALEDHPVGGSIHPAYSYTYPRTYLHPLAEVESVDWII